MTKKSQIIENTNTVAELEHERSLLEKEIRKQKRIDAELELQLAVEHISEDGADSKRRILKACYSYIGTHRRDL